MIGEPEQVISPSPRRTDLLPILTLFLLLLAFFVLLGAISKFEINRTQVVLGSLNATFRTADPIGDRREFGSLSGQILGSEQLEGRLDLALRTAVGIDRFDLDRVGSLLRLNFDAQHLFQAESHTPLPGLTDVSEVIADALAVPLPGAELQAEIYVEDSGGRELASGRAVAVGRSFVAAGVESRSLTIGMKKGTPGTVEIVFRVVPAEG